MNRKLAYAVILVLLLPASGKFFRHNPTKNDFRNFFLSASIDRATNDVTRVYGFWSDGHRLGARREAIFNSRFISRIRRVRRIKRVKVSRK